MSDEIVREQAKLDLINGLGGLFSDLLEPRPDEHGTGDVIALNATLATLTGFNTGDLLGFAMKLLNLPAEGTNFFAAATSF